MDGKLLIYSIWTPLQVLLQFVRVLILKKISNQTTRTIIFHSMKT